jgi:hypothetical protein
MATMPANSLVHSRRWSAIVITQEGLRRERQCPQKTGHPGYRSSSAPETWANNASRKNTKRGVEEVFAIARWSVLRRDNLSFPKMHNRGRASRQCGCGLRLLPCVTLVDMLEDWAFQVHVRLDCAWI